MGNLQPYETPAIPPDPAHRDATRCEEIVDDAEWTRRLLAELGPQLVERQKELAQLEERARIEADRINLDDRRGVVEIETRDAEALRRDKETENRNAAIWQAAQDRIDFATREEAREDELVEWKKKSAARKGARRSAPEWAELFRVNPVALMNRLARLRPHFKKDAFWWEVDADRRRQRGERYIYSQKMATKAAEGMETRPPT